MPATSLPVVPLRGSVLFPGVAPPISPVRERSRRAVLGALRDRDPRVLAQSRNGSEVLTVLPRANVRGLELTLVDDHDQVRAALRARRRARA